MPIQQTSGNVTADAYGGGVAAIPNYIEDVFSTTLYTGNGSTQTITNGIDLAGKGGMVWIKDRTNTRNNALWDTARGFGTGASSTTNKTLISNTTDAEGWASTADWASSPSATGFTVNQGGVIAATRTANASGDNYASWTFRKQPKFFDVVTYTGDGVNPRNIPHNLGSTPGCIIVKRTNDVSNWAVYHQSLTATKRMYLNDTTAAVTSSAFWSDTTPTSTVFTVGSAQNAVGSTYVAYVFAHNAGGFGLTGTDNVISCGSFTTDGSGNATVNLGYEPQWMMTKNIGGASNWQVQDTMRGWNLSQLNTLAPNTSSAEAAIGSPSYPNTPTATGFQISGAAASATFIYIAIRRGPMKVPTDATKVFIPTTMTGNTTVTTNFPVDLIIDGIRNTAGVGGAFYDRLRGSSQTSMQVLFPYSTSAETNYTNGFGLDNNTGYIDNGVYGSTIQSVQWNMRRAPSFFDEVCYTGNATAGRTVAHNLTVAPELIIVKVRSTTNYWTVYTAPTGNTKDLFLNATDAATTDDAWNNTTPTSSVFTLGAGSLVNGNSATYVAYLFATCAGVSKVFSFTGTGSLQTINCGFTSGARFVLVKRTDSTGDWYVWDSARGISSSTDPYLLLNSTAAEVTSTNWVDTTSTGFQVTAASGNNVNINGATYIGLAIA